MSPDDVIDKLSPEDRERLQRRDFDSMTTEGLSVLAEWRQAQKPSVGMDILKSVASGPGYAYSQLATLPGKLAVGYLPDWAFKPDRRAAGERIQADEAKVAQALGGTYTPQTPAGGWAKDISAAMTPAPLPGIGVLASSPTKMAASMLAGGLGGAAAHGAAELELGPLVEALAAAAPGGLHATKQVLTPGFAQKSLKSAWDQMTPAEKSTMMDRLLASKTYGAGLMPWQAAPEGSALRRLGAGAARHPESEQIQKLLRDQTWSADDEWVALKTGQRTGEAGRSPIPSKVAQELRDAAMAVARGPRGLELHPQGRDARVVRSLAGKMAVEEPMELGDWLNQLQSELAKVPARLPTTPGSSQPGAVNPAYQTKMQELRAAAAGQAAPPTRLVPVAETVGQVTSELDALRGATEGTKQALTKEVRGVLEKRFPEWAAAEQEKATVSDLASVMAEGQKLKGAHIDPGLERKALTALGPEVQYAWATTPWWAITKPVRKWARGVGARKYDVALGSTSVENLMRLMQENPQLYALAVALQAAARPVERGTLGTFEGEP